MTCSIRKTRVTLLTNMISPARLPLYASLAKAFDLLILHGGNERNRDSWAGVERSPHEAHVRQAWGWKLPLVRKKDSLAFDEQYLHVNPGYFWHLIRFSPDVVVTSELGVRTILALVYGLLFTRPVWVWWGGTVHTERNKAGTLKRFLRPLLARCVRHWISYGQSSTQYLTSLGVPRSRILELQNAANEDYFRLPAESRFHLQPRPVLLYVGQFIGRKGIGHFLRAAAALQSRGLTFSILLVGGGPGRGSAEQLARDLGIRNIQFHSSQAPELMPSVYRSADVFVFPTLEDPWGLVANEAVLAGLPVLCSKYAGCAEELFAGESVFDPENAREFQEKLRLAVEGRLPQADATRLKSSSQVAADLITTLRKSARKRDARLIERDKQYERASLGEKEVR